MIEELHKFAITLTTGSASTGVTVTPSGSTGHSNNHKQQTIQQSKEIIVCQQQQHQPQTQFLLQQLQKHSHQQQLKNQDDEDEELCKYYEDNLLPLSFSRKRHTGPIEGSQAISKSWRIRDRMKTVSVALVVCLNVGVDPPDVFKISPCARLECWIDPSLVSPQKAMEMIGVNLQKQYERWQPRARYKQSLDPTVEDVKKLCCSLRRNAKEERVLFHYNGHGVPRPTVNGEIWVFNRTYTQYIPLSIYDLQTWMGAPSIYVYDCSNAGIIVNSFNQFAEQHEREMEQATTTTATTSSTTTAATTTTRSSTPVTSTAAPKQQQNLSDGGGSAVAAAIAAAAMHNSANTTGAAVPPTTAAAAAPSTASTTTTTSAATTNGTNDSAGTNNGGHQHSHHNSKSNQAGPTAGATMSIPKNTFRNCIQLAACAAHQILPMNPKLPADLFTACLTTPIKIALKWFTLQQTSALVPHVTYNLIERIPGQLNDRRTMLGELNWIFTAITDTIAWNTLPRDLFQKLFRQDLLVASLFRNFLLADRIMRSYDCTPISHPPLPRGFRHPMWSAWDLAVDLALQQLPNILENGAVYVNSPFFEDQLTAFHVWLERGAEDRNPPEQLPIVLQVLLSQVHRLRALELLGRFLDLGPWAVNLALSVGIFPYVLKLLQASAKELRPLLVFIWAKILAVDNTCQVDLICDQGHKYFLSVLQDSQITAEYRTLAAFVLASIVHNFPLGQSSALQGSLISICLVQITDENALLRQWLAICLGHLWKNYDQARWSGVRDLAHEKLYPLLVDPVPEVRAAAVYALGTFISSVTQHKDRSEHANNIDRSIAMTLLTTVGNDMSPVVRMELIAALQWMIILFENQFVAVFLQEPGGLTASGQTTSCGGGSNSSYYLQHTLSLERNPNMKRVSSSSSIVNMSGGGSLINYSTSIIGFGSTYMKLWNGLIGLCRDPHPDVAQMAIKEIDFVINQAVDLISAKEAAKENFSGSSLSLPPSPNTRVNSYLRGDSPPTVTAATASTLKSNNYQYHHSTDPASAPPVAPNSRQNRSITPTSHSRKNSKNLQLTAEQNAELNGGTAATAAEQQKPIVSTNFIPWAVSLFSAPSNMFKHTFDKYATDHLDRQWRFKRNENMRRVAKEQHHRSIFNRFDTQWLGRTQHYSHIVKLHPYEQQIALAYKNKITVNDWTRGTFNSYVPMDLASPAPAATSAKSAAMIQSQQSRVTTMDFINSHDMTLVLSGYEDGCIRIWQPPTETGQQSRLVTAFQAMTDLPVTNKFAKIGGLITAWQPKSQTICCAGESRYIRCWDAESELKLCDMPTSSDSSVICLSTAPNELLAAGLSDGSVRLFDKRCGPAEARVRTYCETSRSILTACLRDDNENLVAGDSTGVVRFFDIRRSISLSHWQADCGNVTTMTVHQSADILACGSSYISVYGLDGRILHTIKPHGFMGPKIGHIACLSFHPIKVSFTAGFIDNTVAVYIADAKRQS